MLPQLSLAVGGVSEICAVKDTCADKNQAPSQGKFCGGIIANRKAVALKMCVAKTFLVWCHQNQKAPWSQLTCVMNGSTELVFER